MYASFRRRIVAAATAAIMGLTTVAVTTPPASAQHNGTWTTNQDGVYTFTTQGTPGQQQTSPFLLPGLPKDGTVEFELFDGQGNTFNTGFTADGQGVYGFDAKTGIVTFTPDAKFIGEATRVGVRPVGATGRQGWWRPVVVAQQGAPVLQPAVEVATELGPVAVTPTYPEGINPSTASLIDANGVSSKTLSTGDGTWTVGDGTFTFTPKDGFTGQPAPAKYTATGAAGPSEVRVVYALPAPPPVQEVAPAELPESVRPGAAGQPVTQTPAYPPNLDRKTVRILDGDREVAELAVAGEGTWEVADGAFTFTPDAELKHSPAPITYTARDIAGLPYKSPGSVSVQYPDGRTAPVLPDATVKTLIGQPAVQVPAYADAIDRTSVRIRKPNGVEDTEYVVPGEGKWSVDNGVFTFFPGDGLAGSPSPITYIAADKNGVKALGPATVRVEYAQPELISDSLPNSGRAGETGAAVKQTPAYSSNVEKTSVRIVNAEGALVEKLAVPNEGIWTVDGGEFTFTPYPFFKGNPKEISYSARDKRDGHEFGNNAKITVAYPAPGRPILPNSVQVGRLGEEVTQKPPYGREISPRSVRIIDPLRGEVTRLDIEGQGTWTVSDGVIAFMPQEGFESDPWPVNITASSREGRKAANVGQIEVRYFDPGETTELPSSGAAGKQGEAVKQVPPYRGDIDRASVRIVSADGNPTDTLVVQGQGVWKVTHGEFTFTPEAGFKGSPDPVWYTATNTAGKQFATPAPVVAAYPDATPEPAPSPGPEPGPEHRNQASSTALGWIWILPVALLSALGGMFLAPLVQGIPLPYVPPFPHQP